MLEKKLGKATRDAYGEALVELGKKEPRVIVLDADLSKSTKSVTFADAFPERFINVGIMEANLVGVAAGLAGSGKIPFVSSFASFLICKSFDQMRMAVSASGLNVKLVGSHGGISLGEDGASQMSIEDYALVASIPGFTVISPADEFAARALVIQAAHYPAPVYIRTGRPKAPIVYHEKSEFKIGKGVKLREGKDLTIVACGLLVFETLQAAEILKASGVEASVIDIHTIKPIDEELLVAEAKKTKRVIVAEEHQIWGGLGSVVARVLSEKAPSKMGFVAIQDTFAESGKPDELLTKYGMTADNIVQSAKKILA